MWSDTQPALSQAPLTANPASNIDAQDSDIHRSGFPLDHYNKPLTPIVKWRSTTTVKLARNVPRELLDDAAPSLSSRVNSPSTPAIRPRFGSAQLTVVGDTQPNTRTYIQTSNGTLVPRLALNTLPPSSPSKAYTAQTARSSTSRLATGGRSDWNKTARSQQRVKYGSWFVPPRDWQGVYGAGGHEANAQDADLQQPATSRARAPRDGQPTSKSVRASEAGLRQATLRQELASCYALTVYKK